MFCCVTEKLSTKRLEKDFGNAAYTTIRAFILKFENLGLLSGAAQESNTRLSGKKPQILEQDSNTLLLTVRGQSQ